MSKDPSPNSDPFAKYKRRLSESGFPFQIAVEARIRETERDHGWNVAASEHPYGAEDKPNYVDIILAKKHLRLVVDCKRVMPGADSEWVFLAPQFEPTSLSARVVVLDKPVLEIDVALSVEDLRAWSSVKQAAFAILPKDKATRLLEPIARELLKAAESYASDLADMSATETERPMIFVPVIVTNAELVVCNVDPKGISLSDGVVTSGTFGKVDALEFRKTFSTKESPGLFSEVYDTDSANRDRQRSVYVVNASRVVEFLAALRFVRGTDRFPPMSESFRRH